MKRLSIIVPTYNMEELLGRCIESVVSAPHAELIELLVVNDGSHDGSLRIATDYAAQYPDIVRVIDKENGNYGSTINAALPVAKGEYIRILDADDRYDSCALGRFIELLEHASGADMIITPYIEEGRRTTRRIEYDIYSRKLYNCDQLYDAERVMADGSIRFFAMHAVAYRTALLRECGYRQSEGISYTDQEWVFYPLFHIHTMLFADMPIYRYNTAREGQTMDTAVQLRHLSHLERVAEAMALYYASHLDSKISESRRTFLREIIAGRLRIVYRKYLLEMPDKAFNEAEFTQTAARLDTLAERCNIEPLCVPVNNMLKIDLLGHWRKYNRRHAAPLRPLLRLCDRTMVATHALLFRLQK